MKKRPNKSTKIKNNHKFNTNSKGIFFGILALVFILIVGVAIFALRPNNTYDENTVAWVNGVPVLVDEYVNAMHNMRSTVISNFLVQGRLQSEPDFWVTPAAGITPLEALRQAALDSLVETKVILALAQESGFIGDISHQAILENMEQENRRRAQALAAGQVVFGPEQFTPEVYLDVVVADVRAMLRMEAEENVNFTEEELLENFYRYWAGHVNDPGVLTIKKIHVPFNDMPEIFARSAAYEIYERIQAGEDFNGPWEGAEVEYQHLSAMRGMGHPDQAPSLTVANVLEIGDISGVYRDMGGYSILKYLELNDVTYFTFYESRFSIINAMAGHLFEQELMRRVEDARVSINSDVFYRIDQDGVLQQN